MAIPAYQALPDFLKDTKFTTPPGTKCAWQKSVNTELDWFPYYKQYPEKLGYFQKLMSVPRDGDWLDVVQFAEAASAVTQDRALFVDIGGNIGHQSKRLRSRYPNLAGRVIVQDLPETINALPPFSGIEFMSYDFFTPQPIKGMFHFRSRKRKISF
jgi:demethylsterigmatocystin 6-O-methyltransferase